MKKIITVLVMLACVVCTASADNSLSANITGGRLVISMVNEIDVTAYDFHLYLPTGATIAQKWNEDDEEYVPDVTMSRTKSDHGLTVKEDKTDGSILFGVASPTSKTLKNNSGEILSIGLDLSNVADGTYTCAIKSIWFAKSGNEGVAPVDVDFEIEVKEALPTGISGVNAVVDLENAVMYNAAGQKVSKGYKGLVIMNGKKVMK